MKTARQAVDQMKKWSESGKTGFKGWCLKTCRTAWGVPGREPSAIKAWEAIPDSKRNYTPGKAPIGACHFFDIGKFGHIVIQSDTVGMVWGTDSPESDKVGLVKIDWFAKHWHAKYLGWSTYLNGKDLPCPDKPKRTMKSVLVGTSAAALKKAPVSTYDHKAAAKGGGVDDVKKPVAKKVTKKVTKKAGSAKPRSAK